MQARAVLLRGLLRCAVFGHRATRRCYILRHPRGRCRLGHPEQVGRLDVRVLGSAYLVRSISDT